MEIIKETENTIFYKNSFGGVSYRFKIKDESEIIEGIK